MKKERLISPRLIKLLEDLDKGCANAVEEFWYEIEKNGAPLIENLESDNTQKLVTFIARQDEKEENSVLICQIGERDLVKNVLRRLGSTNIYYISYKVPDNTRTTYEISRNNPLEPSLLGPNWEQHGDTYKRDPLNPNAFIFPKDDDYIFEEPQDTGESIKSVIELPAAVKSPWALEVENVPKGKLQRHKIYSKLLNNERILWVYTPAGYMKREIPCSLLLLFDGWAYHRLIPVPTILDNLIFQRKIPPVSAVFVGNAENERSEELPCNHLFSEFISREVIPWVRRNYNVTVKPENTVAGGLSYGGLAASFMGLMHPEIFGNILSQSGSYWWAPKEDEEPEWLVKQYVMAERLPLRFYLEVGKFETQDRMVATNRHFRDVLMCKKCNVIYSEFSGGHDYICWRETFAEGIIALLGSRTQIAAEICD